MNHSPKIPLFLLASLLPVATSVAQNGLQDIPDVAPAAQREAFKLPEGAQINLFASDPDITKPVHMNWDAQGRLWVVASPLYPHIKPGQEEMDSVMILEDTDNDGTADKFTKFADQLYIPTAVAPGDGGAYVANSTELLFLKDTDGDGVADERKVVLSGFGTEDTHHLVHTFQWGPEGMLYFNQSIYIHSHIETPYGVRRLLGGGMWQFQPETRKLEVYYKGLVNPWGTAWNRWGRTFANDGAGSEGVNYTFPRAVFKTSPGASRVVDGLNPGQPKHCGLEFATGRHIPEEWQGTLMAPDFRGHRINRFAVNEEGSGFASNQIEDLVASTHRAFRPIDVKMGPDGAIYIADWYNPIIQHGEVDFRDERRDHKHGRIWRITFKDRPLVEKPNIVGANEAGLIAMLKSPEGWTRQMAKQELRSRGAEAVMPELEKYVDLLDDDDLGLLEAIWSAQGVNVFRKDWAMQLLESDNHQARAAALQAFYFRAEELEAAEPGSMLAIGEKYVTDPHPQVRLGAISLLAQVPSLDSVQAAMVATGMEKDEFLDFALWSIAREHEGFWLSKAESGENPFANEAQLLFAARAVQKPVGAEKVLESLLAGKMAGNEQEVIDWIAKTGSAAQLETIFEWAAAPEASNANKELALGGLIDATRLRKLRPNGDLAAVTNFLKDTDGELFNRAATLSGLWKVVSARPDLETAFAAADKNEARARAAMDGLRALGGPESLKVFQKAARDKGASYLVRSLGVIGASQVAPKAAAELSVAVLQASPEGKDPHGIYDAFLATKQAPPLLAEALKEATLPQEIALVGVQKASSAATRPEALVAAIQKAAGLKPMKMALTTDEMNAMMNQVADKGDAHRGEMIYRREALQCIVCHAIGEAGGLIGPNLVSIGSSAPVDYLIESLLEPSKKIKEGYHTTLVTTKGGQAFAGAVDSEDETEVVIRDAVGAKNRIAKSEIANTVVSPVSLMPPGLTAQLREDEFVNLVRFLSELGKEGDFKTPSVRYARHWKALLPHPRIRDVVGHYGDMVFAEEIKTYEWKPFVSKVGGALPVSELPEHRGRGKNRHIAVQTELEVLTEGPVVIELNQTKDLSLFVGLDQIKLPEAKTESTTVELNLKPGIHKLTFAGLKGWGLDEIRLELKSEPAVAKLR